MRVLIADKLSPVAVDEMAAAGLEVSVQPTLEDTALVDAMKAFAPDVLVVRSTKVRSEHFDAAPSVQLVVRAGAGVNTIDLTGASQRAITVSNCPGMNAVAVAELTMGHILNADRRIADNVRDLRAGEWRKKQYAKALGLKGRTLGVIGCGSIGRAVIQRAQAFEMNVVAYSPELDRESAEVLGVKLMPSPIEVARMCSILTVHTPLNDHTRNLINADVLAALPDGATVINTSRGGIVDETALAQAVQDRGFRAGLDVFAKEPSADGSYSNPIIHHEGVYGTHHIGASTTQAQNAVAMEAVRIILTFAESGQAPNCVNLGSQGSETHQLVVRHYDRVGVLAAVLDQLRIGELNVQGMENVIYTGPNGAACATIRVEGPIPKTTLNAICESSDVINVKVVEL